MDPMGRTFWRPEADRQGGGQLERGRSDALTARERATLQDSSWTWGQEMEPLATYGVYRAQKEFAKGRQGSDS